MRPVRSINGLPNNLVQMFFSTHAYSDGGYMADHLGDVAFRHNQFDIRIDILHERMEPASCAKRALRSYLPRLRGHIAEELHRHQLPPDHVAMAEMEFSVRRSHTKTPIVIGKCAVTTKQGRVIKGKSYTEQIYPMNASAKRPDFNTPERPWWKFW